MEIPGAALGKINRVRVRWPTLCPIRTVQGLTGVPINHVVVVSLPRFRQAVDTLGGVTVNVPKPILSDKFGCPS